MHDTGRAYLIMWYGAGDQMREEIDILMVMLAMSLYREGKEELY